MAGPENRCTFLMMSWNAQLHTGPGKQQTASTMLNQEVEIGHAHTQGHGNAKSLADECIYPTDRTASYIHSLAT